MKKYNLKNRIVFPQKKKGIGGKETITAPTTTAVVVTI